MDTKSKLLKLYILTSMKQRYEVLLRPLCRRSRRIGARSNSAGREATESRQKYHLNWWVWRIKVFAGRTGILYASPQNTIAKTTNIVRALGTSIFGQTGLQSLQVDRSSSRSSDIWHRKSQPTCAYYLQDMSA